MNMKTTVVWYRIVLYSILIMLDLPPRRSYKRYGYLLCTFADCLEQLIVFQTNSDAIIIFIWKDWTIAYNVKTKIRQCRR